MSADTWFPMYPTDLLDREELTTEQAGALSLILSHTWERGKWLPDNDTVLARVARVAVARWRQHIRPALVEIFDLANGCWEHGRLAAAWEKMRATSEVRAAAGQRGGLRKSLKNKSPALANATANGKQTLDSRPESNSLPSEGAPLAASPADFGGGDLAAPSDPDPDWTWAAGVTLDAPPPDPAPPQGATAPPADAPAAVGPSAKPPAKPPLSLVPTEPLTLEQRTERLIVGQLEAAGIPQRERWGLMNGWKKRLGGDLGAVLGLLVQAEQKRAGELRSWMFGAIQHREDSGQAGGRRRWHSI